MSHALDMVIVKLRLYLGLQPSDHVVSHTRAFKHTVFCGQVFPYYNSCSRARHTYIYWGESTFLGGWAPGSVGWLVLVGFFAGVLFSAPDLFAGQWAQGGHTLLSCWGACLFVQ